MTTEDGKRHYHVKKKMVTGLLILFPIGVTFWLLNLLVVKTQKLTRPLVEQAFNALDLDVSGAFRNGGVSLISFILVVLVVYFIGWLANFYLGKQLLKFVDNLMMRLPVVRNIYGGTKQIIEAFSVQRSASFKKVVLLEYPKKDCWVLGFVTNESLEASQKMFGHSLIAVFVPSTPNPTTGFLLYLNPFDLYLVDLDVEEAVKLIVSAGLVLPKTEKKGPVTMGEHLGLKRPEPTEPT